MKKIYSGVSYNKVFAKLASDMKKPDASTVITRGNYRELVWGLPTDDMMFVNKRTAKILRYADIRTIGDIANAPIEFLKGIFGKNGEYLHRYANGDENSAVRRKEYVEPVKSIGNHETTPRDMETIDDVWRVICMLSDSVATRLRKHQMKCRTVKVYIRDRHLGECDRQAKLERPSYLAKDISAKALEIFRRQYEFEKPLRTVGVRASDLLPDDTGIQSSLFDDIVQYEKDEVLEKMMDEIRGEHRYDIIHRGTVLLDRELTTIPADYNRSEYRVGSFR